MARNIAPPSPPALRNRQDRCCAAPRDESRERIVLRRCPRRAPALGQRPSAGRRTDRRALRHSPGSRPRARQIGRLPMTTAMPAHSGKHPRWLQRCAVWTRYLGGGGWRRPNSSAHRIVARFCAKGAAVSKDKDRVNMLFDALAEAYDHIVIARRQRGGRRVDCHHRRTTSTPVSLLAARRVPSTMVAFLASMRRSCISFAMHRREPASAPSQ